MGAVVVLVVILAFASQCGGDDEEPTSRLSGSPSTSVPRTAQPALAAPVVQPTSTTARSTTTAARPTTTSATPAPQPRPAPQPAPRPQPAPEPEPEPAPEPVDDEDDEAVHYENCDAVRAAGAAPIRRGEPGYRSGLDRDGDGEGCGGD